MVAAVVLAAGAATRFGAPKQRLLLGGVVERLRASRIEQLVVVLGAHDVETDVPSIRCPEWENGPGASLRCGLGALSASVDAAVIVLADGPDLSPAAVDRVLEAWQAGAGDVLAATYDGRTRNHPVLLGRRAWNTVPDRGARALEPVLVPCDDLPPPGDVDYPGDLPGRLRGANEKPDAWNPPQTSSR